MQWYFWPEHLLPEDCQYDEDNEGTYNNGDETEYSESREDYQYTDDVKTEEELEPWQVRYFFQGRIIL